MKRVEWLGTDVRLRPTGPISGEVRPPGSKSLTNRYLTCAALADGPSLLRGVSCSDDAHRMVAGLSQLGVVLDLDEVAATIRVQGCGGHVPADWAEIDAGNAGTAIRFLTALATLGHGRYRLDGSARMRQRPIGPLVAALAELGAGVGYDLSDGFPPVTIAGRGLSGGRARIAAPESSQFVSAVLMVAPYAAGDIFLTVDGELPSEPYVEMTIDVMRSLGVEVLRSAEGRRFVVAAGQRYRGGEFAIEPDASAATYFWAAAAVTGGRVRVVHLGEGTRQGDARFADVLVRMGCGVQRSMDSVAVDGPARGALRGIDVDLNGMPDTVQTLAVVALFASGPTTIRNVANLRLKETDRLSALATELTRLGARVDVRPDGLTIEPPAALTPAAIETYDDHRMAMSFAVAGLAAEGVLIKNAGCVSKSFPSFFDVLERLG